MTMSYTVILHDSQLPERIRHQAECRYRQALENALGSPGGVLLAWKAWQRIEDARGDALDESDWRVARRWILAADLAHRAGVADVPELPPCACFEVRPAA